MTRDRQHLSDYLAHITQAINRINEYVDDMDEISFLSNSLVQDAVVRNIEVIGEASRNICRHFPDFVEANSQVPFSLAYEMRNSLSHGYFKIDYEIVWRTIERDLPELQQLINELEV
ncbi:MAG: DUF86 domain-containing protein [Moraxellaceae bacterium]|nr:MAG: DUF86 domain-containing protein [Moraxellaceae bacterium]